ncbi:MAG: DUF2066 domain-containing protein [Succinivibrio sp.]|nr:DUF2066 domain-containing protein [Succinivibrio sp.]
MKFHSVLGFLSLCVGASLAQAEDLSFSYPVTESLDAAIMQSLNQAVSALDPNSTAKLKVQDAGAAFSQASLQGTMLSVSYDSDKLSKVLAEQRSVQWSGLSEPVLIWLYDTSSNYFVSDSNPNQIAPLLAGEANTNHYRLLFPVMDIDDVQLVNANTVIAAEDPNLVTASRRYDAKFYVAGTMAKNTRGLTETKLKVYDGEGHLLGAVDRSGDDPTVAHQVTTDIAQILMNNTQGSSTESAAAPTLGQTMAVGPYRGFVRIAISGISNLTDYRAIRSALVTYGYESSIRIVGYSPAGVIMDVATSGSAEILDGTFAHASEFTKIGDWHYQFNNSAGPVQSSWGGVGRADPMRITSIPNSGLVKMPLPAQGTASN